MTTGELWLKGLDLASISMYLLIITIAVLMYVSRSKSSHRSSKKS
jgi:hypothetical protein